MIASNQNVSELTKRIDRELEGIKCPNHPKVPIIIGEDINGAKFFYCGCDKMKNMMKAKLRSVGIDDVLQ